MLFFALTIPFCFFVSLFLVRVFIFLVLVRVFRSRSYDEFASLNAAPVSYVPPSSINVAERIVEVGGDVSRMPRNSYVIQLRGYTSDE